MNKFKILKIFCYARTFTYILQDNDLKTRTRHKLEDISLIYQYFEERINGEFITSEDSLNHFIDILSQSEWIKRAEVYIDGFHNFSTLEYQIIKALVQSAKKLLFF